MSDPQRSVPRIIDTMEDMRQRHPGHTFEGVGISLPSCIDPVTHRLVMAPNLRWGDFDIKGEFERLLQLPVELNNATNVSLLSELWFGRMDGVRNTILVTIVEGIGTAILASGQILSGLEALRVNSAMSTSTLPALVVPVASVAVGRSSPPPAPRYVSTSSPIQPRQPSPSSNSYTSRKRVTSAPSPPSRYRQNTSAVASASSPLRSCQRSS